MTSAGGRDLQAFLDESQANRARDPFCYVLAAGVCGLADADAARATMEQLRLPGQLKVHWRDESHKRRRQVVETVAALPLQHLVVVRDGRAGEAGERQRRHCLERMLFELDQLQVDTTNPGARLTTVATERCSTRCAPERS